MMSRNFDIRRATLLSHTGVVVFLAMVSVAAAQQPPRQERQFRPGQWSRLRDLPPGKFRSRVENLPAAARQRALQRLQSFHFPERDLESLQVDAEGAVFYVDDFTLEAVPAEAEPAILAGAAVPVSPFPAGLVFHSRPGAPNVLYLNFTGENVSGTAWNTSLGRSLIPAMAFSTDSDYSTFSDAEQLAIKRVWQRVAEDFAVFDIDVTTERPAVFGTRTAHALITRNTDANGAANPSSTAGGVAYVNVFGNSSYATYRPAWVYFNNLGNSESYIAEAASHEIGHNLGLSHDGTTTSGYYGGHGSGDTSWAPLMGTGYNRNVSQWSRGEYYLANNTQDDLVMIAAKISYRLDDHGDTPGTATPLTIAGGTNVVATTPENDPANVNPANKGVLDRNNDVDVFSFETGNGAISLAVNPWIMPSGTRGGNLDVLLELYNEAGTRLLTNNPANQTVATIQMTLAAGRYYLHVRNTGVGSPLGSPPSGYTSYASMGQYFISGYVALTNATPPTVVTVTAGDAMAGEPGSGQGTGTFIFSRTGSTASASTANYTVAGTASSGIDYTALGTSVTFAAGSATATNTVSMIDDTLVEADETVVITLAGGSGYTVGSPGTAMVTIKDDDGGCTPTALVTGTMPGTARTNYDGWVGMRLRVGTSLLEVQSLGRIYVSGNSGNHELRLVEVASTSTVASVVWTPAGGVHNQIKYAALAAPVTLAANTEYYLASREVGGGDQWYHNDTVVTTTSAAVLLSSVYSSKGSTWITSGAAGHTYGPVSLQYCEGVPPVAVTVTASDATAGEPGSGQGTGMFTFSRTGSTAAALTVNLTVGGTASSGMDYTSIGTTVTFVTGSGTATKTVTVLDDMIQEGDKTVVVTLASGTGYTVGSPASATVTIADDDGCAPIALVTGATPGTVRTDYNGWVGMRLRVGTSPLEVQSLGRIHVNGNGSNHELRLVDAASTSTVASVVWTPAGGMHNQIKYAALAAPVTLAANTEYYLASREVGGGDQWYHNDTVVTTTSAAAVLSSVYSSKGSTWIASGTAGHSYGPVSLQYCGIGASSLAAAEAMTNEVPLEMGKADAMPAPRIAHIAVLEGGKARLTVSGHRGQRCEILASEDLMNWSVIGDAAPSGEGLVEFTDPDAAKFPIRFYRVVLP